MESASHGQGSKGSTMNVEEGMMADKPHRQTNYFQDRLSRQTKVEFPMFDGNRVGFSKVKGSLNWTQHKQNLG